MPNLFVDADAEFCLKIAVANDKDDPNEIYCQPTVEMLKEAFDGDFNTDTIEEHELWFRYPDFGSSSSIFDKSIEIANEEVKLNLSSVRMNRIIALLKRWSFTDGKGNAVPATAANIRRLDPHVASIITILLENKLGER